MTFGQQLLLVFAERVHLSLHVIRSLVEVLTPRPSGLIPCSEAWGGAISPN